MDQNEIDELKRAVTEMMLSSIGPMSAMTTSQFSTTVTSLVDAHKEFTKAAWPEWMIAEVLTALAGGQATRKRS
jgi:hypothetical protein